MDEGILELLRTQTYYKSFSFIINKRWIKEKGELLDGRKYTTGISMNISDYSSLVRQLNLYGFRKVKRCRMFCV